MSRLFERTIDKVESDVHYQSTPGQMREFTATVVWKDFERELALWLTALRNELEDPDVQLSEMQTRHLRGCADAIRKISQLPFILAENLETLQTKQEEGE